MSSSNLFAGFRTPPGFAWKWTFCEEWQILGGIVSDQAELGKWASLLHEAHKEDDPRLVARQEFIVAQSASSG